jgi:hypothetical protein
VIAHPRVQVMLALALLVWPGFTARAGDEERVALEGKAVTLDQALKARNLPAAFDPETTANQVVLLARDAAIIPLLADDASRALFKDKRLRDRPIQIHGRRFAGLPYLQVLTFKVEHEGRFQFAGYECDVCTIRVRFPQACPCCQGPMVLRFKD